MRGGRVSNLSGEINVVHSNVGRELHSTPIFFDFDDFFQTKIRNINHRRDTFDKRVVIFEYEIGKTKSVSKSNSRQAN